MTPDQLLLAGSGALGLALWLRRRSNLDMAQPVLPALGARGPIYDLLHPMREPLAIGNTKTDFYEKHLALRAMSGGFKTTLMAQILRERIKAGRSCVVLTGGDSSALEEEIRAWGGWVIRPHDSPLKFNAFEGRASYMAQGWAGLFPTNTEAKVYHSAFEIAAIRYFQTHSSYSVRGLMSFMLTYDPDTDPINQIELENGEVAQRLSGRLWKGMKEGYVGIRLQLMEIAFGDWIGNELSVLHCVRQRIPIMFVLDSADDPDLNRFACALVWQAINYAVREHGNLDAFVDELGRLPPNLVGDQIRTWRHNKSHLVVGSHKDEDFTPILEDLIHIQLLGQMVASATKTRQGASEKTWGTVHPTNFGAHVLGQEWTRAHAWLRRPRQGRFWMVDLERVQKVTVNEYRPPKDKVPRWSLYHLNASAKQAVHQQSGDAATHKTGAGEGYVMEQVTVPVSPVSAASDLGTAVPETRAAPPEVPHGPVLLPRWTELDAHTRKLGLLLYHAGPPLDPRTCTRIRLSLKGKGKRPGFQYQGKDWLMYDFVMAVEYAMEQGFDAGELQAFLSYVKLKFKTGELSVDHLCEQWMGTEGKLCVRPEHLGWETIPANTDLHWERWWQDRRRDMRREVAV